jgi:predicted nucleotidyltransferase
MTPGKDYRCKVVYDGITPFAVIALSGSEGVFHIMELLVKPGMRNKGLGTALLHELLSDGESIIGSRIGRSGAVIFPCNTASQKAFEKAGFVFDHSNDDGDAWYYCYTPDRLSESIQKTASSIVDILHYNFPSIYLYGSVVLGDFKLGWSDIDILVLTRNPIAEEQANRLVNLREELRSEEPDNLYYHFFEGGMLTLDAFINQKPDRVVYWGTSGQRITDSYHFESFSMKILLENGRLLCGEDVRDKLTAPTYAELKKDIENHLITIRKYAHLSGNSLYSFGWMLDISRCIYTLRTGKIIAKTAAGEWALKEGLCPTPETLEYALKVRRTPWLYKDNEKALEYAGTINGDIQRYADVLEREPNLK